MEEVDWSSLHRILSDTTRRNIIELLAEKEVSYTEIMSVLRITNTGRLNYHLKALSALVSKDQEGKYRLTERGKLAATMLRTFPERVHVEKKKLSTAKMIAAALLILVGVLLIFIVSFPAFLAISSLKGGSSGDTLTISSFVIPQNTTVFLTSYDVQSDSKLNMDWIASSPIYLYVLNSTQYDSLLLQHSTDSEISTYIENFTGTPSSYSTRYYLQGASISPMLLKGQYYFFAESTANAILDSFTLTSQQYHVAQTPWSLVYVIVLFGIIGIFMIILAILILTGRLWR